MFLDFLLPFLIEAFFSLLQAVFVLFDDDYKLISSITEDITQRGECVTPDCRYFNKHLIANPMAVAVVDRFEVIKIQPDDKTILIHVRKAVFKSSSIP